MADAGRRRRGSAAMAGGSAVAVLLCALLAAVPLPALAGAGQACREQAAIAERASGIPPGLLLAIGKRESGRPDPDGGGVLPWPWSVNREGEDHVFATQAEAVAYVAAAQREGSRSIDVGCFQINLKYHPDAFATLEAGFDPTANAAYAARFLAALHDREGNWEAAVADYHSATPGFGEPYRDAVLATWRGTAMPAAPVVPGGPVQLHIVLGIRIWEPAPAPPAPATTPVRARLIPMVPPRLVHGLPQVITPATAIASR